MVEVFKTNVEEIDAANKLSNTLYTLYPEFKINFDLDDCDKILRVEGKNINHHKISQILISRGFECFLLE